MLKSLCNIIRAEPQNIKHQPAIFKHILQYHDTITLYDAVCLYYHTCGGEQVCERQDFESRLPELMKEMCLNE